MTKVDTLCICLRLAPVGLLIAVHCSSGHWATDEEARDRALRYGFSQELFSERPLSVLTHMFVHISSQHLLSNVFTLASTLMEFGGEASMRDNVEEDEVPVAAQRSLGSLVVMTLGGVIGGLGGQLWYNKSKVAQRQEEVNRLRAAQKQLKTGGSTRKDRERIVGEPRKGMSKIRKPNMSRLWTDDGSLIAKNLIGHKSGSGSGNGKEKTTGEGQEQQTPPQTTPSTSQAQPTPLTTPSSPPTPPTQSPASYPPHPQQQRNVSPSSIAEMYTTNLRERIIQKMRGFVAPPLANNDGSADGSAGHNSHREATDAFDPTSCGHVVDGCATIEAGSSSASASSSSLSPSSASSSSSGDGFSAISRAFKSASLSVQAWSAGKAAEAQALLNRNMLMCGASAGVCALSGFNLTYYRRPITALCLVVPEMAILAHEIFFF